MSSNEPTGEGCVCGYSDPVYKAPETHRPECRFSTASLLAARSLREQPISERDAAEQEGLDSYRDRMIGWIVNGGVSRGSAEARVDALIAVAGLPTYHERTSVMNSRKSSRSVGSSLIDGVRPHCANHVAVGAVFLECSKRHGHRGRCQPVPFSTRHRHPGSVHIDHASVGTKTDEIRQWLRDDHHTENCFAAHQQIDRLIEAARSELLAQLVAGIGARP